MPCQFTRIRTNGPQQPNGPVYWQVPVFAPSLLRGSSSESHGCFNLKFGEQNLNDPEST
jgi:hypothetical protein